MSIHPGLSIPELFEILKHTFREKEFDAARNIVMDRDEKKSVEIENLKMEIESVKKVAESEKKSGRKMSRFGEMGKEIEVLRKERDELKRQKAESDAKAERYRIRIENLVPRIINLEGRLADVMNVNVEDLAPLAANSMEKIDSAADKGETVDANSDKGSEGLGNKSAVETKQQRCHRTDGKGWQCRRGALPDQNYCESHMRKSRQQSERKRAKKLVLNTQSVNTPLQHLDNGDGSLIPSSSKDDGANTAGASPVSQSGESRRRAEQQVPVKVSGDLIEISDSEDETNSGDKFVLDNFPSVSDASITKRKRKRMFISDEEDDNIPIENKENEDPESTRDIINGVPVNPVMNAGPCDDSEAHGIDSDSDSDLDSEDDTSCSDSDMDNLVATIQSTKFGRT